MKESLLCLKIFIICMCVYTDFEKRETATDSESLNDMEVVYPSLSQVQETVSTMSLWRMQVCAIARLRILKLKRERKAFLIM